MQSSTVPAEADISAGSHGERLVVRKPRLLHIEFLRIFAIYFVIFNHTGSLGYLWYAVQDDPFRQWLYLALSIFARVAVPLFYMVSGALLLRKEEPLRDILSKRFFKFLLVLIVMSALYWVDATLRDGTPWDLRQFFVTLYTNEVIPPLWYLYSYLALMLMLPILRRLAQSMENGDYLYMASMAILFTGVIPILEFLLFQGGLKLNDDLKGALFTAKNIVFFMMGHYLEHVMPEKYRNKKVLLGGVLLSALSLFICCALMLYRGKQLGGLTMNTPRTFHDSLIAIPTYTVYLAAKMLFDRIHVPQAAEKCILAAGSTTFGIYLLEEFLRWRTVFLYSALRVRIRTMPACLLWVFFVMVLGCAIVLVLKKLPVLRKVL